MELCARKTPAPFALTARLVTGWRLAASTTLHQENGSRLVSIWLPLVEPLLLLLPVWNVNPESAPPLQHGSESACSLKLESDH